ncbi:hypothetical protein CSUI_009642, partial [Cystoisospora suis]
VVVVGRAVMQFSRGIDRPQIGR